jgi:uncharacterized protein (UPF0335 family)
MVDDMLKGAIGDNAKKALKDYIDRVERLESDKQAIADDIKDIYADAKGEGFDTKIMRQVIRRRKLEREERDEIDSLIETYEGVIDSLEDMMS